MPFLKYGPTGVLDAAAEEHRAHVEGGSAAVGRDVFLVGADHRLHGRQETAGREDRHHQLSCRLAQPLGVQVGTEGEDPPVFGAVGLQSLEAGLAVVQDVGALAQRDDRVLAHRSLVPSSILVVGDIAPRGGAIGETEMIPVTWQLFKHAVPPQKQVQTNKDARVIPDVLVLPRTLLEKRGPCQGAGLSRSGPGFRFHG